MTERDGRDQEIESLQAKICGLQSVIDGLDQGGMIYEEQVRAELEFERGRCDAFKELVMILCRCDG